MDKFSELIFSGYPVVFLAGVVTSIIIFISVFKNANRTRAKIILGAFLCYTLAQFSAIVVMLSQNTLPNGFSVNSLGLFGFQMFMLSESIQTDPHVDNGDKKYRKYRVIPLITVPLIIGMIWWCISPSGDNQILSIILLLPLIPIVYLKTKHLIIPDKHEKTRRFILRFVPLEFGFYLADLFCFGLWYRGYETLSFMLCVLEGIFAILIGIVIYKESRGWKK